MLIVRNTSGSDYDQSSLDTWGEALNMVHVLEHGSQGPPCNAPYNRVSAAHTGYVEYSRSLLQVNARKNAYPFGDRSPLAAGRRAFVSQYCSKSHHAFLTIQLLAQDSIQL